MSTLRLYREGLATNDVIGFFESTSLPLPSFEQMFWSKTGIHMLWEMAYDSFLGDLRQRQASREISHSPVKFLNIHLSWSLARYHILP